MAVPPLHASLHVQADHSCNWRCCFGCKEPKSPIAPHSSPVSHTEIEEDTTHKVTRIYHSHPKNILPKSETEEINLDTA